MDPSKKLTKKQKKALAFRERKGKGKAKDLDADNDLPQDENQDRAEAEAEDRDMAGKATVQAGTKEKPGADGQAVGGHQQETKRKRAEEEKAEPGDKPRKKKKARVNGGEEGSEEAADGKVSQSSRRYILFVGNLKYTTTEAAIQKHFAVSDPPPTVRLRKPKLSTDSKPTAKSKGFAFVEFSEWNGLQQALKLHQSQLDGRMINVELTAGGGGKSEGRLEKLKQRNKALHEERKKQQEKKKNPARKNAEGDAEKHVEDEVQVERPQRYSATSGVEQAPTKKRTWSIPESTEQTSTKRRSKKKTGKPKDFSTGVNAIPVG